MNRDLVASILSGFGISKLLSLILNNIKIRGPLIRAVNYHGTPKSEVHNLRKHLAYYKDRFSILNEQDLLDFIKGDRKLDRPGLLITFDDGLKSNYSVAAEILEEFGAKGFFFIPVHFVDLADDREKAEEFFFKNLHGDSYRSFRCEDKWPMSWSDVRDLKSRGHSVGSHGYYHHDLSDKATRQVLSQEIVQSKEVIEQQLGGQVSSFCWPFGSPTSYSRPAYELIQKHYRLGFTTFGSPFYSKGNPYAIDRANVEASMRLPRVQFAVLGGAELYFRSRRRFFEKLIQN